MPKIISQFRWLACIVISCLLCACQPQHASEPDAGIPNLSVEAGGELISAMPAEPSGLIYMVAGESASATIASNIFNALLKYNENLDLAGELAESWQISDDKKSITFTLKPNLTWADGQPLTSEDVLFTWQLVTDEKTRSPYASDFQLVKKAEAPDALTFRVTYEQAFHQRWIVGLVCKFCPNICCKGKIFTQRHSLEIPSAVVIINSPVGSTAKIFS